MTKCHPSLSYLSISYFGSVLRYFPHLFDPKPAACTATLLGYFFNYSAESRLTRHFFLQLHVCVSFCWCFFFCFPGLSDYQCPRRSVSLAIYSFTMNLCPQELFVSSMCCLMLGPQKLPVCRSVTKCRFISRFMNSSSFRASHFNAALSHSLPHYAPRTLSSHMSSAVALARAMVKCGLAPSTTNTGTRA